MLEVQRELVLSCARRSCDSVMFKLQENNAFSNYFNVQKAMFPVASPG